MGQGLLHIRDLHIYFALLILTFINVKTRSRRIKKNTTNNHGVGTFLLSGNYRNVQIFNI